MAKKNPTSISKTAIDSLHAKLSAIDAGWLHDSSVTSCDDNTNKCHPLHVYTNLLTKLHQGPKRRQSPLVNAGYAARIAVMTYTLGSWFAEVVNEFQADASKERVKIVNVVMVGCGMDALGIWGKHILDHTLCKAFDNKVSDVDIKMNVYEFDSQDNCNLKKEYLVKSGLLTSDPSFKYDHDNHQRHTEQQSDGIFHLHVRGRINLNTKFYQKENDYTLVSLDLSDIRDNKSILSDAIGQIDMDRSQPSIVLSELVLAYLGYKGVNGVLSSISDIVNGNQLSAFVCLEPMFPRDREHNGISLETMTVEESYARDYSQKFLAKLQTGKSYTHERSHDKNDSWLHPIGSDMQTINSRLATCALTNSSCSTLRECAACIAQILRGASSLLSSSSMEIIGPKFMCAKEPFDEHAALALNLECYCVICSFHPKSSDRNSRTLNEKVCPWSKVHRLPVTSVLIKPIASSWEDAQVNDLYGRLYLHLYSKFPSIQKMVKSALKDDLSLEKGVMHSVIRNRFVNNNGDFWVAVTKDIHSNTIDQSDPVVLGCIGIKQRDNGNVRNAEDVSTEYEIYRFAVDDSHRGVGVGTQLLQVAEESCSQKGGTKLYAVTPSCLKAANKLYETRGYLVDSSKCFMAGVLQMNVYAKALCGGQA